MLPIILNTNLEKIGAIDDYISFIWVTRYYKCGDFELVCDISEKSNTYLKEDYYVIREDDKDNAGVIEKVRKETDPDGHEILIASGRFLPSLLGRRIIAQQTRLNTTVANAVYSLLLSEVIEPENNDRTIANIVYDYFETPERITAQYTGDNLLTTIETICETHGLGHKMNITDDGKFKFRLYRGVDRSYNQSENTRVIFSDEYDNLTSSLYENSKSSIVTNVLVAGEGEGVDRKTLWAGDTASGLNRYETFADKRDLSTNEGEISDAEYNQQLNEAGLEAMTGITTAFSGEVNFYNNEYRKDVNVGDICVIQNTKWGIYINSRLVEVIESTDSSGQYTIVPTFGI